MEIDRSSELTEVIITTDPSDWRYIAEGSANLTIAYSPPPSRPSRPQLKNKCLRLRKRPISSAPEDPYPHRSGSPDQQACPSCPRERRIDSSASSISTGTKIEGIDFHRRIIGSLMGPHLLLNFEPVKLESAWLSNLVTVIEPTRPNSKRVQESIDAQMQIALMMDNLTSNPAEELAREMISVEIKPKWSFLPQAPNLLDSSTAGVKTEFCRTTPIPNELIITTSLPIDFVPFSSLTSTASSACEMRSIDCTSSGAISMTYAPGRHQLVQVLR